MKEILTAAGALGSRGMIRVPAFHHQTKLGHQEARELLVKLLGELGDHTRKRRARACCSNHSTAKNATFCARCPMVPLSAAMSTIPASPSWASEHLTF